MTRSLPARDVLRVSRRFAHGPAPGSDVLRDYPSLVREIATARRHAGLSQIDMDAAASLASGHTAKIEALTRCYGPVSLAAHLSVLRMGLVLVPLDDDGLPIAWPPVPEAPLPSWPIAVAAGLSDAVTIPVSGDLRAEAATVADAWATITRAP